eukprot:GDKJ01023716.1.p1 GENE.GDKJ01023716.1~~GDKJ01023716.1.p1  ORF type:complete len:273 (-),score=28.01 GDKJ01023716.1:248-1066(-)
MLRFIAKTIPSDLKNSFRILRDRNLRIQSYKGLGRDFLIGASASFTLFGISDLSSQYLERNKSDSPLNYDTWDRIRTGVVATQGFFLNGVLLTPFYRFLEVTFSTTPVTNSKFIINWGPAFKKVIFLQMCFVPLSTATFLFLTPVLEFAAYRILLDRNPPNWKPSESGITGLPIVENFHEGETRFRRMFFADSYNEGLIEGHRSVSEKFKGVYLTSCWIWPAIDVMNMKLTPLPLRPVFDSFMDMFWTSFLTLIAHEDGISQEKERNEHKKL